MSNIDVLIVGAGPVGLTLAVECQRYGIPFRIVEKLAEPSDKSKALAIWSGTNECLAAMGVLDDFLARSMPGHGIRFFDSGKFLHGVSIYEGVESAYPIPQMIPQCWTEELLTTHLQKAGRKIERGVGLIGMKNEASGVEAELTHADGTIETVRANWLASCEGAHSYARHQLPITFEGKTLASAFILCDGKVEGDIPDDHLLVNWGKAGVCVFFPVKKGTFRLFTLRHDTNNHEPPTLEEMNECLQANGLTNLKMVDPEWLAFFSVNERFSSRVRVGRVFLLGDAAHIHSPAGGQGMNTGMQDAFNFGWKLSLLTKGNGDPEALAESFHEERHPVAWALIEKTGALLRFGMANNAFLRAAKDVAVKYLFQTNFAQSNLSGQLSELHICYPKSPLVIPDDAWPNHHGFEPGSKPRDAELQHPATKETLSLWRLFLAPSHTLILFSGQAPTSATLSELVNVGATASSPDAVQTIIVWNASTAPANSPSELYLDPEGKAHNRYGLDRPGWYLVRPDQYLAARSATLKTDRLKAYLKKVLG